MQKLFMASLCISIIMCASAQNEPKRNTTDTTVLSIDSASIEGSKNDVLDNVPTLSLDDNDFRNAGSQSVASQLSAGRDPFYNEASFNFSFMRFRLRGYDADLSGVYINGISMNGLDDGNADWSLWSGLNDVFRNRDANYGMKYNTFAFGSIGSTANIDVRASQQTEQTLAGTALTNRNYNHAFSFTHSTGVLKKGWAFTTSVNYRYANEGYVPGTFLQRRQLVFCSR